MFHIDFFFPHRLTNLIFIICHVPSQVWGTAKMQETKLCTSPELLGAPSHCFHRSLWPNPSGLMPSDTATTEETWALSGRSKWKSVTLPSLTLLASLHHSPRLTWFPRLFPASGIMELLVLLSKWSPCLCFQFHLILVLYLRFPRTSPDSFTLHFWLPVGFAAPPNLATSENVISRQLSPSST